MSLDTDLRKAKESVAKGHRPSSLSALTASCKDPIVPKSLSVLGPYRSRDKWRLVLIEGNERKSSVFESRAEAETIKTRLIEKAQERRDKTVEESLDEYRDYRVQYRGVKLQTAEDHCRHLRDLLPAHLPIASLTAEKSRRLYLDYAERPNKRNGQPLSVNTHQWALQIAKCWGKWCVKAGIIPTNPFGAVEPVGKPNAGKQQLRIDEAKRLNGLLVERAQAGDQSAVGVLLMLHLGLRQGEVSARIVRDVDADGRILVIPFGKTEGSRRRLRVPEWLRPFLLSLTNGKEPAALLFSVNGRLVVRQYWWRKVQEWCAKAGVPPVCPHSLRGLHATLAIEEGSTCESVARALGHQSFEMTAKHYASADSVANARSSRVSQALAPKDRDQVAASVDPVATFLAGLTASQLAELKHRLVN